MKINIKKRHLYILIGLIILASVGYVIAQTPGVSHHPAEINPQGSGSGLDADKLDGYDVSSLCRGDRVGCPSGFVVGGGKAGGEEEGCRGVWGQATCNNQNEIVCNLGTKRQTSGSPNIAYGWYLCIT